MRVSKDYRESAWDILHGRYWWAVLAGLIASLLGGAGTKGSFDFNFRYNLDDLSQRMQMWVSGQIDVEQIYAIIRPFAGVIAALGGLIAIYGIAMFIVGSAVELGYNRYNLALYEDRSTPKIETLFSRFAYFGNALLLRLLMLVKTLAWMLLLIIPGIVAAYRYAMAPYLMAEHPDMSATEAVEQSKRMMAGNKWRLFCLHFSFIGWFLLSALTGGIGMIFLTPYVSSAVTAFYLDLTGRLPASPVAAAPAAPAAPTMPASTAAPTPGEGESSGKEFI